VAFKKEKMKKLSLSGKIANLQPSSSPSIHLLRKIDGGLDRLFEQKFYFLKPGIIFSV
jgi:hypothetical protein